MKSIWTFLNTHPFSLLAIYYVLSAAISALPAPVATSGNFYQWFYKFSNTVAANLFNKVFNKIPQVK